MPTHSRNTILLATDQQRSVLSALHEHRPYSIAYTAYGLRPSENSLLSLLGFNGELPDPLTGHYHLGNGYRQFNPVLMRFNSPDSWSPFGEGGLNAYGYCGGDPRNRIDNTGHAWLKIPSMSRMLKTLKELPTSKKSKLQNSVKTVMPDMSVNLTNRKNSLDSLDFDVFSERPNLPDVQTPGSSSNITRNRVFENAPTLDSRGRLKSNKIDTTKPPTTKPEIKTQGEYKPHNQWARRQQRKLDAAEANARHSHNERDVIHYRNKLTRAGFDYN
jgi:RHS repeat-associated protein